MSVSIVNGNLLLAKEEVIAHQVNCQGQMNSGVAKQIRKKYPRVFTEYENYVKTKKEQGSRILGKCLVMNVEEHKWVANLFGQEFWGYDKKQYTSYEALKKSMYTLKSFCIDMKMTVAMPYMIGCDRGGGDWDIVFPMIEEVFNDYDLTLYKI